ncbi:alpha/beta hydrolase family protein [Ideonella sp. BN130291]|uniref:alpha/beta hydrolase family protein n=1 Tax=Ideonella sp. BN130291 TaxID=3112940 RepID=UPI002E26930A|nr:alpha/beta family hydrolase [Ideonella sp. BN130291]
MPTPRVPEAQPLRLAVPDTGDVSAALLLPQDPTACFVFAHGAGAGMDHALMRALATALCQRGVATLRFQFPAMERGSKRPDSPAVAHAAVRAAVALARSRLPGLPLLAGGKSFGGRMTSQAQAAAPLEGVRGLVFVGFPLHPAGKPGRERAEHLSQVACPMLFLQGTRDALADVALLHRALAPLADRAHLVLVDDADHAFHVRASSGRNDAQVMEMLGDEVAGWTARLLAAPPW